MSTNAYIIFIINYIVYFQFIETATMAPEFQTKKYTVMKNGKKYIKVVKYIVARVPKTTAGKVNATEIKDSDFLEK